MTDRVVIIGAGVGGLAAALELAAGGLEVVVLERAPTVGGKTREVEVAGRRVDSGPTVLTMRWVFEELFARAGLDLAAHVGLRPLAVLARHDWQDGSRLDLHADRQRSAEAIADFAGPAEGRRFLSFCDHAAAIYRTLEGPFLKSERPSPIELTRRVGLARVGDMMRIEPFATLWQALARELTDPRLRQLFGRYATYCGASPFLAPATLMLVAHVEQEGVWAVEGGMHRLAEALAGAARAAGAQIRTGAHVREIRCAGGRAVGVTLAGGESLDAAAVIYNGDVAALPAGLLGHGAAKAVAPIAERERSLSAVTWSVVGTAAGFPLTRHGVFFSRDYRAEFTEILESRGLPSDPTVYVCAQDRGDDACPLGGPERFLVLVNAPARGAAQPFSDEELDRCAQRTFGRLAASGLDLRPQAMARTDPGAFAALFPGSHGALYGRASHGAMASFARPGSRSRIPGLYLAGGTAHPGPGVPMAALSARLAVQSLLADLASMRPSRRAATTGGISMR